MKNKIFSFVLLSIIVIGYCGCSKSNPAPFTNYLKGKLDGVAFECTTNSRASMPSPIGGDISIEISGDWPTGSITLLIINGSGPAITAGEYIFEATKTRRGTISVDGRAYYAGDGGFVPTLHGSGKITIQEISSEYVKGIFDFISKPDDMTHIVKTVTNGEFYIKRS